MRRLTLWWEVPVVGPCWDECARGLRDALQEVAAFPMSCLSSDDAVDGVRDLSSLRSMLDAVICRFYSDAAAVAIAAASTGHRSVSALVAAETRANPRATRADQNLGMWLSDYPVISEAFAAGLVSKDHVRAIRARENPRTRSYLTGAQDYLVEAAKGCQWTEFLAVLRYWELASDPDGIEPDDQVQARRLHYTKHADGTVTGRFRFDPLNGHAFMTGVERQVQRLFRHDSETGSLRTASQRRADALVDLATGAAGSRTTAAPLVHIVLSEQVAAAHLDALAGNAVPDGLPLSHGDVDQRCELIDGTPLHPHFALATLATAELRRLVLSPAGERLDLGRKTRCFPPHLKDVLLIRARGRCQHPGCDAPVSWLQADHVIPWSRGGNTSIANGQILCDPHNKRKRDKRPEP